MCRYNMEYTTLGNTGMTVSKIGLGCMTICVFVSFDFGIVNLPISLANRKQVPKSRIFRNYPVALRRFNRATQSVWTCVRWAPAISLVIVIAAGARSSSPTLSNFHPLVG